MKENENIKIKHPILISVIVMIIFFVVIDLFIGLLLLKRDKLRIDHSYYHHDLQPLKAEDAKWGDLEYTIKTNSLGFKDAPTRDIALESEKERILIIGDSLTLYRPAENSVAATARGSGA